MNNYLYNPYFWQPNIPDINLNPPTLYSILESIVNYGKDDKTKIKDLASAGRSTIFDFDYPLSEKITKEKFECMILNHFLMRRIGFETLTAFKIGLNCKINEIIPIFNSMYNSIDNWDLFTGDEILRVGNDENYTDSENNTDNTAYANGNNISDRRTSDTPQDHLEDVRDGSYVTNYSYDIDNNSASSGGNSNSKKKTNDVKNYTEKTTHTATPTEKIEIITKIQNEISNIYKIVYNELDSLFYGIIN